MTTDDTPEKPESAQSAEIRRQADTPRQPAETPRQSADTPRQQSDETPHQSADTPRPAERDAKAEQSADTPHQAAKADTPEKAAEPPRRSPEPARRPETPERPTRPGEPQERGELKRPAAAGPPRPGTPSPERKPERRDAPAERPGRPATPPPGGFKDLALRTPLPKAVLPEALPPQAQGRSVTADTPGARAEGPRPADGSRSGSGERVGPAPGPASGPGGPGADRSREEALTGRQRLWKGVWPPRLTRAQLIVALLLFGLGLGLAIQVRSTNENSVLRGARQEDLVRILDELDSRTQRLQDEKRRLENQRTELENSSDQAEEARKQTLQKEQQLGVLAGTVAAQGPGITITIDDSRGSVESDMLLDTVQELRAAGAEAIQIGTVRVVAGTYFSDSGGAIRIDGRKVTRPYVVKVIGKPEDLEPALNIPGGVVQSLEKEQATVSVQREKKIVVDALRSAKRPDYARSSSR
ncbi:hypothetical protein GCM10009578_044920 [Streptomyces rhizosphaericus]|uniref:DUF881 domain-containing protein n=1 Tax=Streptomyces rhizosphaericus TaxID=114699 RepID=A0ABN1RMA0_9ACTN